MKDMTMRDINPQAVELNQIIKEKAPSVFGMLSQRGKAVYFPKKGIVAQGAQARGKGINATIGMAYEEDGSPLVLNAISSRIDMETSQAFTYASNYGKKELREKWGELLIEKNPGLKGKMISTPLVTCAITHGLFVAGYMFVDPGDDIILPNLYWENYELVLGNNFGGRLRTFPFFKGDGMDLPALEEAVTEGSPGKKILILNFPNNPSGYTPTVEEIVRVKEILLKSVSMGNRLVVFLDDAYFGLVFKDGIYQESFFTDLADLHGDILAIKIDGVTKEDYAWGFRVGFVTYGIKGATDEVLNALMDKTAGAIRGSISNAPHLSQSLILQSLGTEPYYMQKKEKYALLKKRYDKVSEVLENHPEYREYFDPLPHNSGYFMCIRLKKTDSETVRKLLLSEFDTGLIAMGDLLRIAYASTPTANIEKLFDNIYRACRKVFNK